MILMFFFFFSLSVWNLYDYLLVFICFFIRWLFTNSFFHRCMNLINCLIIYLYTFRNISNLLAGHSFFFLFRLLFHPNHNRQSIYILIHLSIKPLIHLFTSIHLHIFFFQNIPMFPLSIKNMTLTRPALYYVHGEITVNSNTTHVISAEARENERTFAGKYVNSSQNGWFGIKIPISLTKGGWLSSWYVPGSWGLFSFLAVFPFFLFVFSFVNVFLSLFHVFM